MPYKEGQPLLFELLCSVPVRRETKKTIFGEPYLPFHAYCHILRFVYEEGALLGRAKREKLGILERMCVIPSIKYQPIKEGQEMARRQSPSENYNSKEEVNAKGE